MSLIIRLRSNKNEPMQSQVKVTTKPNTSLALTTETKKTQETEKQTQQLEMS